LFTNVEYAPGKKFTVRAGGKVFAADAKEALAGSFAAQRLGLKVGDVFRPVHGLAFDPAPFMAHEPMLNQLSMKPWCAAKQTISGTDAFRLYLAEGKKREKLWTSITGSLTKLGVKAPRIETLRKSDDARQLANLLQELLAKD
jgi:hypothetical protein